MLVDAFEQEDQTPDIDYVELTLLQIMEDEFEAVLEDGSAEAVAKDIVRMWEDAKVGGGEMVKGFEAQVDNIKGKKVQVEEVEGEEESDWEDESGEEDEEEDVPMLIDSQPKPKPEPEVDEDGFTTVKGKGSRHR